METAALIAELRLQLKQSQEVTGKLKLEKTNSTNLFVQEEGETYFNPEYISVEEHYQILELENFLKKHPEINNSDLHFILGGNVFYFSFLQELHRAIPNLAGAVRSLGANAVAGIYVGTQLSKVNNLKF